jgi:ubiquinone/menaquinone biosynthesis C-methylase UbiE
VTNLDAEAICKPDFLWDLSKTPYPFPDESYDLIIANHVIEHVPNWWACFNELSRICKVGGTLEIWIPGCDSDSSYGYRDHINRINNCSFYGVFGTYREQSNAWAIQTMKCPANRMKMYSSVARPEKLWWFNILPKSGKRWCSRHLRNVVTEEGYYFRKVTLPEYEKEMEWFNAKRRNNLI